MRRSIAYLIYAGFLLITIIGMTVYKFAQEYNKYKSGEASSDTLNTEFYSPYPADDVETHWIGDVEFADGTVLDSAEIALCRGRYTSYTLYALPTTSVKIDDMQGNEIVSSLNDIGEIFIPGAEQINERQLMMVSRMVTHDGVSFPYDLSSIAVFDTRNNQQPIIILADTTVSPGSSKVMHYSEIGMIRLAKK